MTLRFTGFNLGSALVGFVAAALIPAYGWRAVLMAGALSVLLLVLSGAMSAALGFLVALVGFCMSGAQTGLNAYAPSCYPTAARHRRELDAGHGALRQHRRLDDRRSAARAGLGFGAILSLLAIPALLAAGAVLLSRREG